MSLYCMDVAFNADVVASAAANWPAPDWDGWNAKYTHGKCSCNLWDRMPKACVELLRSMLFLPVGARLGIDGLIPDTSLHGGGMHFLQTGACLPMHRDSDHNPHSGLSRRVNAILYLETSDDGQFRIDGDNGVCIPQVANRLVMFEPGECIHGVPEPVRKPRKTLAVFWYGQPGRNERPRAEFIGTTDHPT